MGNEITDPAAPRQLVEFTAGMDVGLVISNAGFGLRRASHEAHDPAVLTELLMLSCHAPSALKQHLAARDASLFSEGPVKRHVSALASAEARASSW